MKAVKLIIQGKVQAVGYRRWFEKEAIQLDLKGYVKNLTTGEVEAVIIGEQQAIVSMTQHSYVGPLHAQVEYIQQIEIEADSSFNDFKIIRDTF